MKVFLKQALRIITDRLFIMLIFIIILLGIIIVRVYDLQIIHHNEYDSSIRATIQRKIEVDAPRGLIFDRYGRPLAINQPTYVLNVDQGVRMSNEELNGMLLRLIQLLRTNGDQYVDEVPITQEGPFEYRFSENTKKQFIQSLPFKNDEEKGKAYDYTAQELLDYLKGPEVFNIDASIADNDARGIVALRYELFKLSWSKYKLITVATDVSLETISAVEEKNHDYLGVITDVKPVRYYPEGELFSHIIGYTRKITASQFESMAEDGYEKDDVVGQMGLEQTQEAELRGIKGAEIVEVDNRGRKVRTVEKEDEVQGNNVFSTIDAGLQKEAYDILEKQLTEIIIIRLQGGTKDIASISGNEVIYSLVESNAVSFTQMKKALAGTKQHELNSRIEQEFAQLNEFQKSGITEKELLLQWLDEKSTQFITEREIILILHEQKLLSLTDEMVANFKSNKYGNVESVLIQQMEQGFLKPKHMSVDPFSAAAVVVDVNSGEVLSLIGYPSYDANNLITNFNEFYPLLADESDERRLMIDRSMRTAKAPGSPFKMITGIAALEEGAVTPSTTVYDTGTYTKAGTPVARCWSHGHGGHGLTDLRRSLEVSCNYYFYDAAFNLGAGSQTPYQNIRLLTKYVELFGLDQKTGIELPEVEPTVSSPEVVVKKALSTALWNVSNMGPEKKEKYIHDLIQRITKGYIPWADSSDKSLEGRVELEIQHELKRNAEAPIGSALEPKLTTLAEDIITNLEQTIGDNMEELIEAIVTGVMDDSSQYTSLRTKTKQYLTKELRASVKVIADPILGQVIEPLLGAELKEAYEHAYTVAYGRLLRENNDQELIATLKYRMENTEEEVRNSKDRIVSRLSDRVVDNVVEQMIERSNLEWNDGITIRTAIGQGNSAFAPIQIASYITAIANGEHVYGLRIIDGIQDSKTHQQMVEKETVIRNSLNISRSTLDVIYEGMLRVTTGSQGTARDVYGNFEIPIASKTGTTQDGPANDIHEHAWFVAFAPYDNPEVAIVTTIYNADGAGKYGTIMSREILRAYFELDKEHEQITIDNIFTN